jgi:hypothetical protein
MAVGFAMQQRYPNESRDCHCVVIHRGVDLKKFRASKNAEIRAARQHQTYLRSPARGSVEFASQLIWFALELVLYL